MTHHNCHARSKQKRKALRQQNRKRHVIDKRLEKLSKATKLKGKTIYGDAIKVAIDMRDLFTTGKLKWNAGNKHGFGLNQRQKRKQIRQANGYTK